MKKLDIACIIDDDPMYTYILSRQMKVIDFCETLLVFHNGLEALKYLKPILESPDILPDVILLDLNMPVMDGWQFLDEFTKFNISKKVTVYIVSSSIDQADHDRAATYKEVSHFYVKPVTRQNLVEILDEMNVN
ncbi:response regulator [Mucilaginibacter sp. KACC 22063]|uniref:response regulator n=1 Tax=Mucilaginibacter sp. KACC 22063 TaxID=3025666 RepID=UPI0023667790|nr:response regulator [Mucilaginibacter sp. KACC 22063]WDF55224.1 response regulator [Mucilaginibacter sp. KACC 22063]